MVVTQTQFNKAMEEINTSYAKLQKRVEELEAKLKEGDSDAKQKRSTTGKSGS